MSAPPRSAETPTPPAAGRTGLATGVIWNLASLAFLATAGIVLNIIIGRWYGPDALGTFNIAFALFIFLSQIASLGLQLSALHAVSTTDPADAAALRRVVYSGAALTAAVAAVVTGLALLLTLAIAALFPRAPALGAAWLVTAPGLFAFALNKYLLGVVNGLQHMRAFALFQSARFMLLLASLVAFALLGAPGWLLPGVLALSETLLLAGLGSYVLRVVPPARGDGGLVSQALRHARFGLRVFPAGMVAELNTRVDVLMLGALASDRLAGIYTIAALVFEAALQAVVVIRNNISPQLARDVAAGETARILRFSRWLALGVTLVLAAGAAVAWFAFPFAAALLFPGADFQAAREPLFWLMLALPLAGAPLCYSLVLSQGNRPGWQSVVMGTTLAFNIAANALLIPPLGLQGAAIAMGASTILMGALTVLLARRVLGIRLFF